MDKPSAEDLQSSQSLRSGVLFVFFLLLLLLLLLFFLRLGSVQERSRALTWAPPGKRYSGGGHPKMRRAQ